MHSCDSSCSVSSANNAHDIPTTTIPARNKWNGGSGTGEDMFDTAIKQKWEVHSVIQEYYISDS